MSGADLEFTSLLTKAGLQPGAGLDGARLEQLGLGNASISTSRPAVGQEFCNRLLVSSGTNAMATQVMRFSYYTCEKSETITQIKAYSGTTVAAPTPTLFRFGLYREDPVSGDLTLVASTANDTSLMAAASTGYTKSFSAPVSLVSGTRYAWAPLVVTGVAAPTVASVPANTAINLLSVLPRIGTQLTAQVDLPATVSVRSLTISGMFFYAALLP